MPKSAAENIAVHKKTVEALVRQLEGLKQSLIGEIEKYDEDELAVRIDFVDKIHDKFDVALAFIEQDVNSEGNAVEQMAFNLLYFDVKAMLTRQSRKFMQMKTAPITSTFRQNSFDDSGTTRRTRLPEIQLPKFSGGYAEWPNFYALFLTVIDQNTELSDLEKFHHLRSSLCGGALETIASLELKEANYREAVSLLTNRFDNKLLHFQTHIKEIFALKVVANGSAADLRHLSDKVNSHLRALHNIGSKEQIADGLLIYLVTSKMDSSSQMKWEEGLKMDELSTWSSLSKYLELRCRMLENLENAAIDKNQQNSRNSKSKRFVHVSAAIPSRSCLLCDDKDHFITQCKQFQNLLPAQRLERAKQLKLCLNCLRMGHMLKKCSSGSCRKCSARHHTLLHFDSVSAELPSMQNTDLVSHEPTSSVLVTSSNNINKSKSLATSVLLATAIILVKDRCGLYTPCRAILDSASQLNLITSQFVNRLQLKCNRTYATISGIGDGNLAINKSASVDVKSRHGAFKTSFTAMVVPAITNYQPNVNISIPEWKVPDNVQLADPLFDKSNRIDILIGAELFFELMSVGQIKLADHLPILQKTLFGWVVAGRGLHPQNSLALTIVSCNKSENEDSLADLVKSFWEVENNAVSNTPASNEDLFCEQHFSKYTSRLSSGTYSVRLPKKEGLGESSLGDSYHRALSRFKGLERKFIKNPECRAEYSAFMSEYSALNHMTLISPQVAQKLYFLPHHCVRKLDSTTTKLRVVFDGSAKTTSGLSLNDILCAGPTIQPKLFDTLMRYRCNRIALSGDICKMYRCVQVQEPDDYLQCILWREQSTDELKIYKLNTVTYGTKPAAFLAIRTMHKLAADEESSYSLGAKILRRDFYVDDMLSGGNSVEEVIQIRQQVTALLLKGNFIIRKWVSNEPEILKDIPSDQCDRFLKFHDGTDITKTLGLIWDPKNDNFIFSFTPTTSNVVHTKRSILSSIARLYDPLGLIGPVITKAKIFMQETWKLGIHWDESLPQKLQTSWLEFVSKFKSIPALKFPRYVLLPSSEVEMHAFCDASLSAYGACIYLKSKSDQKTKVMLLCSKSRVAPLKTLTVPKLELSAALLLAELVNAVSKILPFECGIHCWSDSTVVLSWIREQSSNFNVFVSNRVSAIQNLTSQMLWHYVPTDMNPADILSRGASPEDLVNNSKWIHGPKFLHQQHDNWPEGFKFIADLPERRKTCLIAYSLVDLSMQCKYLNSFIKLQRTFAFVFKFIYWKKSNNSNRVTTNELKLGTHLLIRNIQMVHFAVEYKALQSKKPVPTSSKLYSLLPMLCSFGLIRVGGRLQHSHLSFEAQHPIILPKLHPFTKALVLHYHERLLHAGPQYLLSTIRQEYWLIGGRKYVASIISKCVRCFRMKPIMHQHVMGSLPPDRVTPNKAFHTTGVDFCGPFFYKSEVRTRQPLKCYISIFTCFSTKACHLEVVQDLTTSSFLAALRRFIATRGKPSIIWSDNATNFVGAKNELAELKDLFNTQQHQQSIQENCLHDGISWKFIPPRSPHFGGLWEAAVKTAKYHFFRAVGLHILTFDELRTLTCQICAIMNSRPLTPITEDPDDLEILTPAHFLVGGPLVSIIEPDLRDTSDKCLSRWQKLTQMQQIFWKKWSQSYLSLLQERTKWKSKSHNIAPGQMVIIKNENLPPLKWQLGRVTDVIRGNDNVIRVVMVRTNNGIIKRAASKVAVLPIEESVGASEPPTGGVC